jgi:peptide/nickel transport system substrate-binding protein
MAMAIDHQALIQQAMHGFAHTLCTDHPSATHPGYEPGADCPQFNPEAARKLLEDNGWLPGPDGVRAKDGQRLEFEYSTAVSLVTFRPDSQAIIQRNLREIGIQLDIENYDPGTFFGTIMSAGEASPPSGAIAGRFDIGEFADGYGPDPDNPILACDQIPPKGENFTFYCNPAIDALYQQELATADPGARQQIFHQLHEIYLSELRFIVLFGFSAVFVVRKGAHGFQPTPFEGPTVTIAEWWCDQGTC